MSQFSRELTEAKAAHARTARLLAQLEANDRKDRFLDRMSEEEAMTQDQQFADASFEVWGRRAPHPRSRGEDRISYRARLCRDAAGFLPPDHELKHVRVDDMSGKATGIFFRQFMEALQKSARDADTVPLGTMRKIDQVAPTGHKVTSYVCGGGRTFVDEFHQPNRRVIGWGDGSLTGSHAGALRLANMQLAR
jgi:hypothetical protein